MGDLLVETKLLVPQRHQELVPRPRLTGIVAACLHLCPDRGVGSSGFREDDPPGAAGTEASTRNAAGARSPGCRWTSVTADPRRFWSYVLHAVERASPGSAAAALELLDSATGSLEGVIVALVNELSVHPGEVTLVLDDYHLVDDPAISDGMGFLLDHLPPQLHLVIGTRADPALPLARLRARGELVEVRAKRPALHGRRGGRLPQRRPRPRPERRRRRRPWRPAPRAGSPPCSWRQPPCTAARQDGLHRRVRRRRPVRRRLPRRRGARPATAAATPLPARHLRARAADRAAVRRGHRRRRRRATWSAGAEEPAHRPAGRPARWYRYHHLFADVLRSRLLTRRPRRERDCTAARASGSSGPATIEAAVRHALAADGPDRAADLIELAAPALRRERQEDVVRRWIPDLPASVVRRRPVLASAFIARPHGQQRVRRRRAAAPRRRGRAVGTGGGRLVVLDRVEWTRLPAVTATHRAGLALVAGDLAGTHRHAHEALARARDDDLLTTAAASALLGLAAWTRGDLAAAHGRTREPPTTWRRRARGGRAGLHRHAGRPRDRPGPARRRPATGWRGTGPRPIGDRSEAVRGPPTWRRADQPEDPDRSDPLPRRRSVLVVRCFPRRARVSRARTAKIAPTKPNLSTIPLTFSPFVRLPARSGQCAAYNQ